MKKKIPLQVLEIIEPYVNKEGQNYQAVKNPNFLMSFIDKDENSDFYFNLEEFRFEKKLLLYIDWKPINKLSVSNKKIWIDSNSLDAYFKQWVSLLEGYESVKTIFDDPIIEAFAEEYYTSFEILEEDGDVKPFKTQQILLLENHLNDIEKKIGKFETSQNKQDIEEIKTNVIELRENLTKKPKKWVIKQLSIIWAKITKQGTKVMKEFLSETKKQIIQKGVKLLIENAGDFIG